MCCLRGQHEWALLGHEKRDMTCIWTCIRAAYDERFDSTAKIALHGGFLGLRFFLVSRTRRRVDAAGQLDWKPSCEGCVCT
jgi:hypothetical protein